jgi:DNA/RNA-binding domain of Phe-tRNA-synthetase-like protein
MKILVDSEIFAQVPDYKIGVIVLSGFDNTKPIPEPEVRIEPEAERQRAVWEWATKTVGIDPVRFPPANISLFRRFAKSGKLPLVNPLVDICNAVSLETGAPNGVHDLDKDPGDIEIRPGKEGDYFIPLGGGEPEPVVDPVVFAAANRIQVRNWTWRISHHCRVETDSKTVIIFLDTLPPYDMVKTLEVMTRIGDRVIAELGGRVLHQTVLERDNPETVFSVSEKITGNPDAIDDLLLRGVANIIPSREKLEELLRSGRRINVYNGIDPTSAHIHLGNAFSLRKLQRLVELGHYVTFLIGDMTTLVGDTSDKEGERPQLSKEKIEENFQTYKAQAEKILDFSKVKIVHNSDWLGKLGFQEILQIFQHFSVGDLSVGNLSVGDWTQVPESGWTSLYTRSCRGTTVSTWTPICKSVVPTRRSICKPEEC